MAEVATINRTYNETIANADKLTKAKDYEGAHEQYIKALQIKPKSEYPIEKIKKLDEILDLRKRITEKSASMSYNKAMQLALKTVLNATYGAFANKYFVLSNSKIANAITAMGRDLIRYMVVCSEDYFYNKWHDDTEFHKLLGLEYIAKDGSGKYVFLNRNYDKIGKSYPFFNTNEPGDILLSINVSVNKLRKIEDKKVGEYDILWEYRIFDMNEVSMLDEKPVWVLDESNGVTFYKGKNPISMYCDTDSISSSSLISTNKGIFTIEELYNKNISSGSAGNTLMGHESVNCKENVLNWNEKLYYAQVERIIRHKVTKPKWKLKTKSGKEVIVTNDHSMIVFRDGIKIEVKPCEILKTDKILTINKK